MTAKQDNEFYGRPVFRADNIHCHQSGNPKSITAADHWYSSYYENCYGEQWVFTFDLDTKTGTLWGGDIGWDNPYSVTIDGKHNLVLNSGEQLWLAGCLMACNERLRSRQS